MIDLTSFEELFLFMLPSSIELILKNVLFSFIDFVTQKFQVTDASVLN